MMLSSKNEICFNLARYSGLKTENIVEDLQFIFQNIEIFETQKAWD